MKKILSVLAVSAFVMTAGVAFAGGPGKKMNDAACPEACQQQIDDLQSSQARQDEELKNHEGRITNLEKSAYNPWYVRVGVRAAWMKQKVAKVEDWSTDAGFGGALAFGRQFGDFRAEVELAKQSSDLKDKYYNPVTLNGTVDVTTVMANGYYEVPIVDGFAFYAMAGVGFAKYDLTVKANAPGYAESDLWDGSDNVFAYKAGAGFTYNFTDDMAADLGYEYLGVADTDLADSINGHNVVLSFRYKF